MEVVSICRTKKRNQPLPHGQTVRLTEGRPVPLSTLPQSCATETCGKHLYSLCGNKPHELIFILGYQGKLQRIRTVSNNTNYINPFSKGVFEALTATLGLNSRKMHISTRKILVR